MTSDSVPDGASKLQEDIRQTREQLAETMQALTAKVDVKARARDRAAEVTARISSASSQARDQAAARAQHIRGEIADKGSKARHAISAGGDKGSQQGPAAARASRLLSPAVGLASGLVAGAAFKQIWKLTTGQQQAPRATDEDRRWREILLGVAAQGVIVAVVRALIERSAAEATRKLTGSWPGDG